MPPRMENLFDRNNNLVFYVVFPFGLATAGCVAVCRSTLLELLHRECSFFSLLSFIITLRIVVVSEA